MKEGNSSRIAPFDRFAFLVVLTVFGVTWPVLDLLGRNAEFFLARRSAKGEIVTLALVALLLVPVMVAALGSLPGTFGTWVGALLIAVTASSLALLYLSPLPTTWWLEVTLAAVIGVGITLAYFRYAPVRLAARYLLVAPLVVLVVFLLVMPVGDVLWEPSTAVGNPVTVRDPAPVVLVVFDEFPVASLIDPYGDLRADLYPNFAHLAADAIWFRNAVTVQQQTEHSVPAILTGRVPDQSLIPVAGQYPFNLFTALRSTYDLHVHEAITQLCPRALCEGTAASATSLARDLGVIAGHVLLPEPLTENLPEIDRGWGDFEAAAGDFDAAGEFRELLATGPRIAIDRFLDDIVTDQGERTPLFYLHMILPHHPWQYLPDGRSYPLVVTANPASDSGGWIDDEFLVAQSMQRHLLQVGYADHVLGELIAALEDSGTYDDALFVVVADHGIAIEPGVDHQRVITETTVGEIAAVPLFVKPPNFDGGVVDDRRALTIDILPTIAEIIEADMPGDIEGVSLLGPDPERSETTTVGTEGAVTYDSDGDEKLQVAARIESLFPGGDPWALRPRNSPDILGEEVETAALDSSSISARILEPGLYQGVDTTAALIPARIAGILRGDVDGDEVVAVVVNGVVGALTRSYVDEGRVAFLAMVPPSLFRDGENSIELMEVGAGGELTLID